MKIGLVGNPNCGKSTLFNLLTGMNVKVGNWPGVTIEKKEGIIKKGNDKIIDLPGIYSLSPYSPEEDISRKFIFDEKPDLIINIIDATNLNRSLYLTTQLLELNCRVILVLNMTDLLSKKGMHIDVKKLEDELQTKVIEISALKKIGIEKLFKNIDGIRNMNNTQKRKILKYNNVIEDAISRIEKEINIKKKELHGYFIGVKLLEGDIGFRQYLNKNIDSIIYKAKLEVKNSLCENSNYESDLEEEIITQRYKFVDKIIDNCLKKQNKKNMSNLVDKLLLNKWTAFPVFATVMCSIYYLSVGVVGSNANNFVTKLIENFKIETLTFLENIETSKMISSLIVDGIINGVGSILTFVPQLIILFLCLSILEESGYMSRVALLLDKFFVKLGLSGKSLIPFIIGSGCSVPGIMSSRIIENENERKMTTILTPFIPCSAKLPIITLFAGSFFKENQTIIFISLYLLAIAVIIISALIMKKFIFINGNNTYISELPEYKLPNIKYVLKEVSIKTLSFIKRAGTVILVASVVVWFLSSFSFNLEYGVNIEESMLASIGRTFSWFFYTIVGVNSWEVAVSSIQGLIAKEQVISSMVIINGLSSQITDNSLIFSGEGAFSFFTKASAYAFIAFNLFSAPCLSAIAAMKKELGGIKKVLKVVAFQVILAWGISSFIYFVGNKVESSKLSISDVIIFSGILIVIVGIIKNLKNNKCNNCNSCNSCKCSNFICKK